MRRWFLRVLVLVLLVVGVYLLRYPQPKPCTIYNPNTFLWSEGACPKGVEDGSLVSSGMVVPPFSETPVIPTTANSATPTVTVTATPVPPPSPPLPNQAFTPGQINPNLTTEVLCAPGFRTEDYRKVNQGLRKKVFQLYGLPYSVHHAYEVDHLIPLEVGGANAVANLWPQLYEPDPGAHTKDGLENQLHRLVCTGKISLTDAQHCIASNWWVCYNKYRGSE